MQIKLTMNWVDGWLDGSVHEGAKADILGRPRHERFIVSRLTATLIMLAALPPYLLARGTPTSLEALGLLVLLAPLAAVFIVSRTGRLDAAQALVSLGLTVFAAGAGAAFGGASTLAVLALAVVPVDALLVGSRRGFLASLCLATLGIPLMFAADGLGIAAGRPVALGTVFAVGFAIALGHAIAGAVGDRRLRLHLQAALRTGETREGLVLQTVDDLVTWHENDGSVVKANSAGARALGAGAQQIQGRGLFNRVHVADRPAYLKALSDAARSDEAVHVQFRVARGEVPDPAFERRPVLVRLGGPKTDRRAPDLVWMEMRAHRLRGPSADGATVVAVTRSIAAHHQRAEDLEARHRKAQRVGEDRLQLLASVSRELRAPLKAIVGHAEALRSGTGPSPMTEDHAGAIHHAGQQMLGLVSSLLDLSAIEAGDRELKPEIIDLASLTSECCRIMTLAAERAGVTLAQDVPDHLPDLWADRQACMQVLLDLVANALKFASRGSTVTIAARREGERVVLAVHDGGSARAAGLTGLALPAGKAFGPFGQAEISRELGLSVARTLVGLHHGRLDVAEGPGTGTSVVVSLPLGRSRGRLGAPLSATLPQRPIRGALALKTG